MGAGRCRGLEHIVGDLVLILARKSRVWGLYGIGHGSHFGPSLGDVVPNISLAAADFGGFRDQTSVRIMRGPEMAVCCAADPDRDHRRVKADS